MKSQPGKNSWASTGVHLPGDHMVDVGNYFDFSSSLYFQVNMLLLADVEMTQQQHSGYDICKIVDDTNGLANNVLVFTYHGKPVRTGPRTARLITGVFPAIIA
eukprot:16451303-Heterocapsa_arctica.AAC.1